MIKKAQAAMEFLMTYGWAILVVLISIAALAFFGVLNPSKFSPNFCSIGPGFSCNEFKVTSNGVEISLRNGVGTSLNSVKMTLLDSPCTGSSSTITTLNDGESKKFTILCNGIGNVNKFKSRISLSYIPLGYSLNHIIDGDVSGKIEPGYVCPRESGSGVVGYWKFDEGSGLVTRDSLQTHDGTISGATWTTGKFGNALFFDLTDFVDAGNVLTGINTPFTAGAWLNLPSPPVAIWNTVFADGCAGFTLTVRSGDMLAGKNCGAPWLYGPAPPISQWFHLTVVHDGTNLFYYKDGNLLTSGALSYDHTGQKFCIGGIAFLPTDTCANENFDGIIDDVVVFNRALNAQEVLAEYNCIPS